MPSPRATRRDYFSPGDRVGDYAIGEECSDEETSTVYGAIHVLLPRKVTLKVLHAGEAQRELAIQMLRAACLLEALAHPAIPRVYECGVLPDRRPWTAIERIEGTSLATAFTQGPIAIADLVVILRDVADLLSHAHARGVVHRRLNADAIVRTPYRPLSVCVRHWDDALTTDTGANVELDARDDVHALGVIAFRALTGCWPSPVVQAADWCPHAPLELTALIDSMLASNAAARPSSDEVRERARWLADTVQQLTIDRPRWTPPHGLEPEKLPKDDEDAGFTIRIAGSSSRS